MIGPDEVGIVTRKMFGKPMPEGQIIAREGEIGVLAKTLMPGLHWRLPFVWSISKVKVIDIDTDGIGLVEAIDGAAGKIQIVPQVLVGGGDGAANGNLFNAWLAQVVATQAAPVGSAKKTEE